MRTERFSPLYPNPSSATDYRRRGMSEVRMTLGGHELRLGVRPQELDLYGQPNTDKPTYFTASIEGLRDDDAYWSQGGPTFTLTDLDTTAGVVGLIRKRLRANAETTREERERISAELDKSNPWIQRLHEARDHLAAVHQQMESAQTGQDTIPELSAAPHTIVRGAPAGPERTRGILSTATTDLTPRPTQGRPTGQHANSTNDLRPTLH
jgi:hypothetical protein